MYVVVISIYLHKYEVKKIKKGFVKFFMDVFNGRGNLSREQVAPSPTDYILRLIRVVNHLLPNPQYIAA